MKSLAFFNNKSGVGKASLIYHLAHMWADLGRRVLLVDLDPQCHLTAMCLPEDQLEKLWAAETDHANTLYGAIQPIHEQRGDITLPPLIEPRDGLALLPGDAGLATFEEQLSTDWPGALSNSEPALRGLSSFYRLIQRAAATHQADLVLCDIGPSLGAINRTALLAVDFVVTPLAPDLTSMLCLRAIGPTLNRWRKAWRESIDHSATKHTLPPGSMDPIGYIVMQAGMQLHSPVKAYQKLVERMPGEYHRALLADDETPRHVNADRACLGVMRNFPGLMPLAHDARKPMFHLRVGDGAVGSHQNAVQRCREDFETLAHRIDGSMKLNG